MGSAGAVCKRRPTNGDDVLAVKLPVGILEAKFFRVVVMQHFAAHLPADQIGRTDQRERVSNRPRQFAGIIVRNHICQRPILTGSRIKTDREFLGAAGKVHKAGGGIKCGGFSVITDTYHGRPFGRHTHIATKQIHQLARRGDHGIALQPAWEHLSRVPDFRGIHLLEAIANFQRRERRFGGIGEGCGEVEENPDQIQIAAS